LGQHKPGDFPNLGFGAGLRRPHFGEILDRLETPAGLGIDWFEVISENFLTNQGWPRHVLNRIAVHVPLVMHGVSLSIGSTDPLDKHYLTQLRQLADDIGAAWVSDHLCWTGVAGINSHDLLPLPLTKTTLAHVVERIRKVQDTLGRPLVLENPSSYLKYAEDTMPEWEFLAQMAELADCRLLLDVNNVYVSAFNHGFDAETYIQALPANRIVQFHLAGHRHHRTHIIDTHDDHVCEAVWQLYELASHLAPHAATLIEWDANLPDFATLVEEVTLARRRSRTGKVLQ